MRTRRSRGARRKAAKSRQAAAAAFARRIGASLSRPGRALLRLRPRKRGRGKATARSRRSFTLRSWSFALKASALVGSLGAIGLALALAYTLVVMPIPQRGIRDGKQSGIEILASDGSLISGHSQPQRYVPLASLPTHLIDAVLATEDRRFYAHWGVDPWGLARATAANVMAMRLSQGGSTITQQLAKNLFLEPRRTLGRKIEEMLYALALEVRYSKQEILELYFNNVYFGGGAYGIAAATRTYFDCEPEDLALAQSALIAGLLKAPSRYAPTNSITLAMERSRVVLEGMADAGIINRATADKAIKASVGLKIGQSSKDESGTGYVADWAIELLPQLVSSTPGKLTVETTIDAKLQRKAEAAIRQVLAKEAKLSKGAEIAFILLDRDGAVRAMLGGRSYQASQYNRAIKARRQPGSAFKPFIYLAAVEAGVSPDMMITDEPFSVGDWTPRNYSGEYLGPITVRQGLAQSVNTVAVKLFMEAGRRSVLRVARRLGISSDMHSDPSLALGTAEVSPLELAGAYVPFANGGHAVEPFLVRRILTDDGKALFERRGPDPLTVVEPAHLAALNDMMMATVRDGTGRQAQLAHWPVGGKTGTTQDFRDAWFIGYTAQFTAAVWVGNDDNSPLPRITGGSLPARLWKAAMQAVHKGMPPKPLPGSDDGEATMAAWPQTSPASGADPNWSEPVVDMPLSPPQAPHANETLPWKKAAAVQSHAKETHMATATDTGSKTITGKTRTAQARPAVVKKAAAVKTKSARSVVRKTRAAGATKTKADVLRVAKAAASNLTADPFDIPASATIPAQPSPKRTQASAAPTGPATAAATLEPSEVAETGSVAALDEFILTAKLRAKRRRNAWGGLKAP
mgnify:CR=1 FL=1